ncbi:MAG: hypothetical protein A4E32_01311 [Methanomassiliicoccales archaeon PtaU1.Bin124]|nr:MAG: hypothetical protein A4E32_01311 [Methanomassiliicoccales archaeon PtaU1.Bin124]
MLIADFFGLEDLFLLEPDYVKLVDPAYSDRFLDLDAKAGRVLIDKEERPLAIAAQKDNWYATVFLHREPSDGIIEAVGEMDLEVFQTDRTAFTGAIREYYSVLLAETVEPSPEDYNPERKDQVVSLLRQAFGKGKLKGRTCLDVGCGTGLGSAAIHELGMHAVSYDMDDGLLSRGLSAGRLFHHETMRIDATQASSYVEPVDLGLVLMAGKVTEFNSFLWRHIIQQTLDLSKRSLITLETEKEAKLVEPWCAGRKVEVFENDRDRFYDRWVVLVK